MAPTNDLNLRFGALALQCDFIDAQQFARACACWVARDRDRDSLASVLAERGWLTPAQRAHVELLLAASRAEDEQQADATTLTLRVPAALDPDLIIDVDLDLDFDFEVDFDDLSTLGAGDRADDLDDVSLSVQNRIKLRELHSSGGIGEVWRAFDQVLCREVALKRLKHDQASHAEHRAHFLREAQITGQLEHPGIVPLYDYSCDADGSHCFYTMRFVQGRTLSEVIAAFHERRIEQGETMLCAPFIQLLEHFASVCNTIAFAHSKRVVHRDLKGDNVIVGDFGEVVVLDWGLAKRVDRHDEDPALRPGAPETPNTVSVTATLPGERLGTPAYMAPEQALGLNDQIDERTDVYGLAAILYEILTGRPPFRGDDVLSVMDAVAHDPPSPASKWVDDVPLTLERICMRGLAKSMGARQQSVLELAAQVRQWHNSLAQLDLRAL